MQPDCPQTTATPSTAALSLAAQAWRVALPAWLLVLVLILGLFWQTASGMVSIWYRSETFAHAFVVPPISIWLIWRRRLDLTQLMPRPAFVMLFPIAGMALLWLLGDLVAVNSVTQLAFIAMVVLSVPAVLGLQVACAITFPLLFLFFAAPIGEFMMPQLMEWTAEFTVVALRASGIPVYSEGLQFVIPSGSWSVVEACSGVRYLIASVTVGTLFAYLNYQTTTRRILFILVSILVPIVANWLRAYMIVMLGHLSGNKLAVGFDHLIYGWAFFGVVIMLMFVIGARWVESEPAFGEGVALPVTSVAAPSAVRLWMVAVCAMAVVAMPTGAKLVIDRGAPVGVPALFAPDVLMAGWRASDTAAIGFKPNFQNPSAETNGVYENSGNVVGLYLGYYRNQDYNRKLVSSNNVLIHSTHPDWSLVAGGAQAASFGQQQVTVRSAELRRAPLGLEAGRRLVAWQIYWVNGTLTASDYLAKVYGALYQLMRRGDDSAVIVIYTEKTPVGDAQTTLQSFLSENYSAIDAILRQAKAIN